MAKTWGCNLEVPAQKGKLLDIEWEINLNLLKTSTEGGIKIVYHAHKGGNVPFFTSNTLSHEIATVFQVFVVIRLESGSTLVGILNNFIIVIPFNNHKEQKL